ncbi:cytochrome P450 [Colletotrichum tamarilloi]|uniref:Cytochrome P450 n=1 Tax=Colletotrichum tamarilloi TaxID=1209934 RepID=A0ABQ9RQP7_9PEZI|nr:cytochrome P450 [Colletotrichum tamarilloi]KAI3541839.1 cytochrome P450 [Colletotrichum filicis]KAK1509831.1 cytochrome P450 [Colletotrichum tamarilloi]
MGVVVCACSWMGIFLYSVRGKHEQISPRTPREAPLSEIDLAFTLATSVQGSMKTGLRQLLWLLVAMYTNLNFARDRKLSQITWLAESGSRALRTGRSWLTLMPWYRRSCAGELFRREVSHGEP